MVAGPEMPAKDSPTGARQGGEHEKKGCVSLEQHVCGGESVKLGLPRCQHFRAGILEADHELYSKEMSERFYLITCNY